MAKFDFWWLPFLLFSACGAGLGYWVGFAFSEDGRAYAREQAELGAECLAGNDRACRMWEVRYGR